MLENITDRRMDIVRSAQRKIHIEFKFVKPIVPKKLLNSDLIDNKNNDYNKQFGNADISKLGSIHSME